MSRAMLAASIGVISLWSQIIPIEPYAPLTVCEVLSDLGRYSGRIIEVRGAYFGDVLMGPGVSATGETVPDGDSCPQNLESDGQVWVNGIALGFPKATDVERRKRTQWTFDWKAYEAAGAALRELMDALATRDARYPPPVMATIVGRLDVPEGGLQVRPAVPPDGPIFFGYGPGGMYPARLVVVSIEDIALPEQQE